METVATPVAARRSKTTATLAAAALFAVVAVIFFLSAANWYLVFKSIHVLAAIVWLGGGGLLIFLGVLAQHRENPRDLAQIAQQAAYCGERIFAPAGLLVVLMGVAMMINGDLDWGQFWVIAGLVGYAVTFGVGIGYLTPLAKKINASIEEHGVEDPGTQALGDRILLVARFDIAMLLLVVIDMVVKPFV
jgi:uncharacterized membrane protein